MLTIDQIHTLSTEKESSLNKHFLTIYSIAYGIQAREVFEFGIGQSSLVLLAALQASQSRLTSCDIETLESLRGRIPALRSPPGLASWNPLEMPSRDALQTVRQLCFDLVLHDGSHEADEVADDVAGILPRVKQFGLMLMHDVEQHELGPAMRRGLLEGMRRSGRKASMTSLPYSDGLAIIRVEDDAGVGTVRTTWCKATTQPAIPVSFPWWQASYGVVATEPLKNR